MQQVNFILSDEENLVLKVTKIGLLELLKSKGVPLEDKLEGSLLCVCRDKNYHEYIWTKESLLPEKNK